MNIIVNFPEPPHLIFVVPGHLHSLKILSLPNNSSSFDSPIKRLEIFKKIFKQFTKKRLFIDDFILSKVYSQYRRDNEKKVINILWKDRGPRKTNIPGCLLPSKIITQKQMCDYFLFIKMCEKWFLYL